MSIQTIVMEVIERGVLTYQQENRIRLLMGQQPTDDDFSALARLNEALLIGYVRSCREMMAS